MELIVKGSFYRDIAHYNDKQLLNAVNIIVNQVEKAPQISKISNLKKLKQFSTLYRIKVANQYRIGVVIRTNKIWFVCFGHRNSFYKRFP